MEISVSYQANDSERAHDETWARFWQHGVRRDSGERYLASVRSAASTYPDTSSVRVNWWDLAVFDSPLANLLIESPDKVLEAGARALRRVLVPTDTAPALRVAITDLPESSRVDARNLRSAHLGRLIAVRGLIRRAGVTQHRPKTAMFSCQRCGALIRVEQEGEFALVEPVECQEDQGGCGRQTPMKLVITATIPGHGSVNEDAQRLIIEEAPEGLRGGEQPQKLTLMMEGDLCGTVPPGERVTVNGVYRATIKKEGHVKSAFYQTHLDVVSVEREATQFEDIVIEPEDVEEIERVSRDPDLDAKFVASLAPSILGARHEKLGILMQLFGGVEREQADGTRLRGDIHIFLIGDPGVAKSQLLRYASRLAPRGIYTGGKSASGAGLTAAAVKDEGAGQWAIEAGAMVLADRGLLCVDEIDKMDQKDRASMHEGLEQQTISFNKAGITATLQCRCAVLGAANPKDGRFDERGVITDQINLEPPLLSRFDLIFILTDKPSLDGDAALANHILETRSSGTTSDPVFDQDFIRKYIAYAKREIRPDIAPDARRLIAEYFTRTRNRSNGALGGAERGAVPMSARQLEGLIRLTEAHARLHLRRVANVEDAECAIGLVEYYLRRISGSEGGMDIDVLSGTSYAQRDAIHIIRDVVRSLSAGEPNGANVEDVIAEAEGRGIEPRRVRSTLARLKADGDVIMNDENVRMGR